MASMNRRVWLKTTGILTGGLTLLPGAVNHVSAAPSNENVSGRFISDAVYGGNLPPVLKARLFANENPFGPSDKAKKAIEASLATSYQYPMQSFNILQEKISSHTGVPAESVLLSAGSSALLHAAAICFSRQGGNIITGDPSYDDLPDRATQCGLKWIKVPLTSEYSLDLDAMEKAVNEETRLVYICNPNNPTGTVVDTSKLKDFCERVSQKTTVFVDEAYIEYLADPVAASLIDGVKKGQDIIVARTFSKLYGFAGLRVGYMLAQPEMIKKLEPFCAGLWCLSAASLNAAIASYQDTEFLKGALNKTLTSKSFLYKVLKDEGYEYIPSFTNFVLFPVKMEGQRFTEEMMKRGVGVRFWKFNNKDWCRVSIGRMDEMQAFAEAFKEIS